MLAVAILALFLAVLTAADLLPALLGSDADGLVAPLG